MGNTCPGSASSHDDDVGFYMKEDRIKIPKSTGAASAYSVSTAAAAESSSSSAGHGNANFYSTFNGVPDVPLPVLIEHFQPYEFPICPVINSHTQILVKNSWFKIVATEYDCEDTASGKISGASYFYNHFFNQLFKRLTDFSRIFPDIKTRADIFSKVMSFCISIRVEELGLVKHKLSHLGALHKSIIRHPYLFGIYASNLHSTIRHCLGDDATYDIMSAWLHVLSYVLRGMMPAYFQDLKFCGHFAGAVNAASVVTEKATEEVKNADEMRSLKKKLRSLNHTTAHSRAETTRPMSHTDLPGAIASNSLPVTERMHEGISSSSPTPPVREIVGGISHFGNLAAVQEAAGSDDKVIRLARFKKDNPNGTGTPSERSNSEHSV